MRVLKLKVSEIACLIGVALVVIGIFLPWAKWPSWGRYIAGSVSGIEVVDGWIFLIFGIVAGVSAFKSLNGLGIGFLRLFPGVILFLGGFSGVASYSGFTERVPFDIVECGIGCYLIAVGGLIILISGLWQLHTT